MRILLAALLHDAVEDTDTTLSELEELFGTRVRLLVEEVTEDKSLPPETGIVTFGDAPVDAAAEHIQVRPSEGLSECSDHCQGQVLAIDLRDLTKKYRRDPACKRLGRHYRGDSLGAALGKAAKEECAEEKARAELGQTNGGTGDAQAKWDAHFDREGARRERQTDRAIQLNEGWQNRAATDQNTQAIQREQRENRNATG